MLGRKLYKTKLCILYQRGRCPRQSCNFAHGDAELRRFAGSFTGRRDYGNGDLRDKLDRRHSPYRRYSPIRDARGHHSFRSHKLISHDRGSSHSRSPIKRSERRYRKKQRMDGESDISGSLKLDGAKDRKKEDKVSSHDEKDDLEEQLKQIQLDIEMLDDHKSQLEIFLEEKLDESQKLSSRIEDLESKLNKEQENCKRITLKIKKFIKAHGRYVKTQEELKRSQTRLQKLGDQLSSDMLKTSAKEEDSSVNVVSDGEPNADGDNQISPRNDLLQKNVSSANRRSFVDPATSEEAKIGNPQKRERSSDVISKSEKLIKSEGPAPNSEYNNKGADATKKILTSSKSLADNYKHKQGKFDSGSTAPLDKYEGDDEDVDVERVDAEMVDLDINSEVEIEQI